MGDVMPKYTRIENNNTWFTMERIVTYVFEQKGLSIHINRIILAPYDMGEKNSLVSKSNQTNKSDIEEYVYWGWITSIDGKKEFVWGSFYIIDKKIALKYNIIAYIYWANIAYKQNWFDRQDLKEEEILL